jgi:hypothetical protein
VTIRPSPDATGMLDSIPSTGKHTLALYGNISSEEASVLIQARNRYGRLNKSLYRLKIVDTTDC